MQVFSLEEGGGQSKLAKENHPAQRDSLTKCNCDDHDDNLFLVDFHVLAQYFWNNFCNISQWNEKVLEFVVGSILIS